MSSSGKSDKPKFGGFFGEYGIKNLGVEDKKLVESRSVARKEKRESEEHDVSDDESNSDSQIRQNFHVEIEELLNKQINLELQASYNFISLAAYFESDDVALPHFSKFFLENSKQEREHAGDMMKYMNKRGGSVVLDDVVKPATDSWETGLGAMQTALDMEKSLNESLLELHKLAIKLEDPQTEVLVKKYLCEEVRIIKKLGCFVTTLKRVGSGLGVYLFGKHTLKVCNSSWSSDSDSDVNDE